MKTLPDLQQIEILILIVKHGSFRQAARALNLSPPALTSAINHLEEKLGVRLLNRSTRSLSLTAVGEEFLNNMTPVVNDYRRVVDSLNYHRLTPEGVVKVNLPRIVLCFPLKLPEIRRFPYSLSWFRRQPQMYLQVFSEP